MDRRQRKTREAIFGAFTQLLATKNFNQITVSDIIEGADVGRATFYAHFETKDFLLKEFCKELFCHIFDAESNDGDEHHHIFSCDGTDSAFLHLFRHLKNNDNQVLVLLSSQNNELFLTYFRSYLVGLIANHMDLFEPKRGKVSEEFFKHHVLYTFMGTLKWWIENGVKESPERITEYFFAVV